MIRMINISLEKEKKKKKKKKNQRNNITRDKNQAYKIPCVCVWLMNEAKKKQRKKA